MSAISSGSPRDGTARHTAFGLVAVIAMVALSNGACFQTGSGPEKVDPAAFSWNAPVSAPSTVYIRNTNGSVEVKPATGGNVEVTAVVKWHRGDPKREIKFETNKEPGGIAICALWGGGTCSSSGYRPASRGLKVSLFSHDTDASVAFTVYVPTGVKVDASTINGSIGVAATAPVVARAVNGTIKVATSVGPVDAETVTGGVDVRMTTLGADGPVRAHSVTGSVAAYLPEKFDGSVEIASAIGGVASDFPGGVKKEGEDKLTAIYGTGSRKIDVYTVTGSASLKKLKADGTVAEP